MIYELNNIDDKTQEGKLLLAAIAQLMSESQKDKTPNQIIAQLYDRSELMKDG